MNHLDDAALNLYLDSALAPSEVADMNTHLAACPECAARLGQLRALFASLDSLPRESAPLERDLSASVVAAIRKGALQKPAAQPTLAPPIRLALAAQAALAIIALAAAMPFAAQALPTETASQLAVEVSTELIGIAAGLSTQLAALTDSVQRFASETLAALTTQPPDLPVFSLALCLAAAGVLWLVGNGVLLRQTSRIERG